MGKLMIAVLFLKLSPTNYAKLRQKIQSAPKHYILIAKTYIRPENVALPLMVMVVKGSPPYIRPDIWERRQYQS